MDIQPINQFTGAGSQNSTAVDVAAKTTSSSDVAKSSAPSVEAPADAVQAATDAVGAKQLDHAVESVNNFVQKLAPELTFSVDKDTGIRVVKVVDQTNNQVIRQIPSKEMLAIAASLDQLQGLLVKQKA